MDALYTRSSIASDFHLRTARTTDFQSVDQIVQRVRRTSSPSTKSYRWINGGDGLEVRRTKRSKRKHAAAHPEAVREYREQERRDKADTAVLQAARRRVRAELRKGK